MKKLFIFCLLLNFNSCTIDEEKKPATIQTFINNQELNNNDNLISDNNATNTMHDFFLKIRNTGDEDLNISSIYVQNTRGDAFSFISQTTSINIGSNNEKTFGITFYAFTPDVYECSIKILSNANNIPEYNLSIQVFTYNP